MVPVFRRRRVTMVGDMVRTLLVLVVMLTAVFGLGMATARADHLAGKRVLHIDSYHAGNEWNDRIAAAVREGFRGTGVDLRIIHMDAKRKAEPHQVRGAVEAVLRTIEAFRPHVVTTSDDPVARFVIMPHFRDADLPIVFSGLNWDAGTYGLPYGNVTGMVEVSPIPQIVRLLRSHARGDRIGFIAEDTDTKRKELAHHEKLFGLSYDSVYLVSSFSEWTAAFRRAQAEVDMLVVLGVGALTDWNETAARRLTEEETRIPTGTDFSWLAPYTLLAVAKVPEEQGFFMAEAAKRILHGERPGDIPLAYNREGELLFNQRIAARLGIDTPPPLARIVP
ncbi:ABC transporter substrate-binding protein [Caenispirillum salinarum]|uniref:ABC transporter substrate-binding protein n=1 Tax=Caenispirillum salinarum TaxID=859058 RepID=UPI00384DE6EA